MLRLIPLHDVRAHLGLGEFANRPAQQFLIVGQSEVHKPNVSQIPGELTSTRIQVDAQTRYAHRMRRISFLILTLSFVAALLVPAAASADVTAFLGATTTPSNRM